MKNKVSLRSLGRRTAERQGLFRDMVTALVQHERIRTTLAKAKEIRKHADTVVTWAKQGGPQHHTLVNGFLRTPDTVTKAFKVLAPRYMERAGGYTRIVRSGFRRGDKAAMAILEYVDRPGELRPARPPSTTTTTTTIEETPYIPLAVKAASALAAQKRFAEELKTAGGTISSSTLLVPSFPTPHVTPTQFSDFQKIVALQKEYGTKQAALRRSNALAAVGGGAKPSGAVVEKKPEMR